MKIPNHILRKIEKHNSLLFQAAKIENEIDDWYGRKLSKKTKTAAFSDEDFADIKCDLSITYISAENLQYNLNLLYPDL